VWSALPIQMVQIHTVCGIHVVKSGNSGLMQGIRRKRVVVITKIGECVPPQIDHVKIYIL